MVPDIGNTGEARQTRFITPEHCLRNRLNGQEAPSWPLALLVFRDHLGSQAVLDAFDDPRSYAQRLLYNLTDPALPPTAFEVDIMGQTVLLMTRCVWGGPQTAILVEELACLGVPLILGCGAAGSIDPGLGRGAFVIAGDALPTDGISRAYGAGTRQVGDPDLAATVAAAMRRLDREPVTVTAAAVDALYRETPELIEEFRAQGGHVVNLETSSLYTVAAACGVRTVWFGFVTDCLVGEQWQDWYLDASDAASVTGQLCRHVVEASL